jgi:predicted acyltransferase
VPDQYYGQSGPCVGCGQTITAFPAGAAAPPKSLGDDAGMRLLLPVGRSGLAIAAGYLGLISVLLLPAPLAVLFGILAIRDIQKHPDKHGMGRAIFGLVLGGLGTIVLVVMFAGLAIAGLRSGL